MALLFKMPSTIADLATAYLIYRLAKKNHMQERGALILAGMYAFAPTLMFVSGGWGQIDSVLALLIALVILLLQNDKRIFAGALYGLAILMKPQALMFGPILAVAFILDIIDHREKWAIKLLETIAAVLAVYARETGQGMVLPEEAGAPARSAPSAEPGPAADQAPAGGVSPLAAVPDANDSPDSPPDGPADPTPGKRPHLRVVK